MALPQEAGPLPLADHAQRCADCGLPIRGVPGSPDVYLADVSDVRIDRVACGAGETPTHRPEEAS